MSNKAWVLKPGVTFRFDIKDIVELFLNATKRWYEDPANDLYGRRANVAYLLTKYLETGHEPDNLQPGMIYALGKFQQEWLEPKTGIFEEIVEEEECLERSKKI